MNDAKLSRPMKVDGQSGVTRVCSLPFFAELGWQ